MVIKKVSGKGSLQSNQFYPVAFPKKHIFLHHTVGPTAKSAIDWWNSSPDHVATPYLIERDGTVLEVFDPKYWSYALGLKGGTAMEKASIHIELVSWGKLTRKQVVVPKVHGLPEDEKMSGVQFYAANGKILIPSNEVVTFKNFYRECYDYHQYTSKQIESLRELIKKLLVDFKIKLQPTMENFWFFNQGLVNNLPMGLWSHSSVRADKSDIMPQKELVQMIYGLKNGI